ncbi:helix-turn-helix domain-containing protein [Azospirillum doebereinerae]|uniref:helix-turn-helix domain-containing protein n=1 Tax=Azospirillum doebereinerae TaxID=92933 RepID=UPI003B75C983
MDAHVGQRVRMRRTLLGMSQEKLGEAIGLTFQQVQKYERGSNRISAGTLYRLGQVLDVPVSFFFDAYDDDATSRRNARTDDSAPSTDSQISRREARLLRLWRAAPTHVSDELLLLLSSLSPNLDEPTDGPGEAAADEDQNDPSETDGSGDDAVAPPASLEGAGRSSRHNRAKPAAMDGGNGKPRRRHGAVWDPTDIVRASKNTPREG